MNNLFVILCGALMFIATIILTSLIINCSTGDGLQLPDIKIRIKAEIVLLIINAIVIVYNWIKLEPICGYLVLLIFYVVIILVDTLLMKFVKLRYTKGYKEVKF